MHESFLPLRREFTVSGRVFRSCIKIGAERPSPSLNWIPWISGMGEVRMYTASTEHARHRPSSDALTGCGSNCECRGFPCVRATVDVCWEVKASTYCAGNGILRVRVPAIRTRPDGLRRRDGINQRPGKVVPGHLRSHCEAASWAMPAHWTRCRRDGLRRSKEKLVLLNVVSSARYPPSCRSVGDAGETIEYPVMRMSGPGLIDSPL